MHQESENQRLVADAAILKALARWAPHARHDVVGACSPIALDLSLLSLKSAKAALSVEDVRPFVERGKANVKNTVLQLDRLGLLMSQDREQTIAVHDVMERMAHAMHTVFAEVTWSLPTDPFSLGTDSEYDLMICSWTALMALYDAHGTIKRVSIFARRDQGILLLVFSVAPVDDDYPSLTAAAVPVDLRITHAEVRGLAVHLGFTFSASETSMEFRRIASGTKSQ